MLRKDSHSARTLARYRPETRHHSRRPAPALTARILAARTSAARALTARALAAPEDWPARLAVLMRPVATVTLVVIAVASLRPVSGGTIALSASAGAGLAGLGWPAPDAADVFLNLIAYWPLGFALVLASRHQRQTLRVFCGVVACGTLLSFGLEALQAIIPGRYPSWLDVLLNAAGTCGGAASGLLAGSWLAALQRHPAAR